MRLKERPYAIVIVRSRIKNNRGILEKIFSNTPLFPESIGGEQDFKIELKVDDYEYILRVMKESAERDSFILTIKDPNFKETPMVSEISFKEDKSVIDIKTHRFQLMAQRDEEKITKYLEEKITKFQKELERIIHEFDYSEIDADLDNI